MDRVFAAADRERGWIRSLSTSTISLPIVFLAIDASVINDPLERIVHLASLATIVELFIAVQQLLLRETHELVGLRGESVHPLHATRRTEGPA